ncbi:MAG: multidrug efflux SMR transporter [Lentisphaerae bacterium]|nr:multidrug efflux SMR transporter [Lentisphaerota bacterium]
MAWIFLIAAGLLEVCWAVGMKYSCGFTKLWPSIFVVATMTGSVVGLALAMRSIPLGTAYAVWTGIGTVGAVLAGIVIFHESASVLRMLCVLAIISGIIGLKLLSVN